MANFKGWTSENYAEMQNEQLKKRLERPIIDEMLEMVTPELLAKAEKRMLRKLNQEKPNKPKGETANAITANLIRAINMQPKCVAYRINNVGVWDAAKQIHRRGNTQKGIFDVSACIRGRVAWFEIKAGRDKPSQDQLIFQQEVRSAGGIAEFVYSTDEGLKLLTKLISEL
jgi:hypothetical protein